MTGLTDPDPKKQVNDLIADLRPDSSKDPLCGAGPKKNINAMTMFNMHLIFFCPKVFQFAVTQAEQTNSITQGKALDSLKSVSRTMVSICCSLSHYLKLSIKSLTI